jgi:hypothetical protein
MLQRSHPVARKCAARLDLDGLQPGRGLSKEVDLLASVIPPEAETSRLAKVPVRLEGVRYDQSLEQRASGCVDRQGIGIPNPKQPCREARVEKIQFGRLDQSLAEISMVRPQ